MKKTLLASAILASLASPLSLADEQTSDAPAYKSWAGIYGMRYMTDGDRVSNSGQLDDGSGLGIEFGYRFDKHWAGRLEMTWLQLNVNGNANPNFDDEVQMLGGDVLYFLNDDVAYFFGGLKHQQEQISTSDDSLTLANIGVGKHWNLTEKVKIVTELAAYQSFDDSYNDVSVKVGFAFPFGGGSSSSPMRKSDSDNDGVADRLDNCPMTPAGVSVDASGCPLDSDNDGVPNHQDQCPATPAGTAVNAQGCPSGEADSDKDGVVDSKDQCANTPRSDKVDANGCTVFGEEEVSITLRVLFDNNSHVVKQPRDPEIAAFADFLQTYPSVNATIEGHTSAPGTEAYNMTLSQERADAFKNVMVDMYGISGSRLATEGYGETRLLEEGDSEEAHRLNRRISVTVSEKIQVPEKR